MPSHIAAGVSRVSELCTREQELWRKETPIDHYIRLIQHELPSCRPERSQSPPYRFPRTPRAARLRRCRQRQDQVELGSAAPGMLSPLEWPGTEGGERYVVMKIRGWMDEERW